MSAIAPIRSGDIFTTLPEEIQVSDECPICCEKMEETANLVITVCCKKHLFHEACLTTWLKKNNSCPMCRYTPITDKTDHSLQSLKIAYFVGMLFIAIAFIACSDGHRSACPSLV